jgi:uncharacterized protein (TIGR03084 family)
MKEISGALAEEGWVLDEMIAGLDGAAWQTVTPFDGWTIHDEISHLAFFDRLARISATDEAVFVEITTELAKDMDNFFENTLEEGRAMAPKDLLEWWRMERQRMADGFCALKPKDRVPWYLPMSAMSSATARLMETWAHGQDVADALGLQRAPTTRLRHVAHIGVATFKWSYMVRGLEPPAIPVRVELAGPSGASWAWGDSDAANSVRGNAEDFCLVVTQRRHHLDTALIVTGKIAEEWMTIAQAFAGPPDQGPPAGTFK